MRLYMMTDLEGVAGVVSFDDQAAASGKYYEAAKRLLTGEVNAAVEGALEAGVTETLVSDGHGAGAIHYPDLHEAAMLLHGGPRPPVWKREDVFADCNYACLVGQHAMEGVADGNMNHTQNSKGVEYYKLNGEAIGEIAQCALQAGAYGLPLIFLSGDEAACREAEALIPGIVTAAVKRGLTRGAAISLAMPRARKLIRERMTEAVRKQQAEPVQPYCPAGPYRMEIRYKHTDIADAREVAGWQRIDAKTVAKESDDVLKCLY